MDNQNRVSISIHVIKDIFGDGHYGTVTTFQGIKYWYAYALEGFDMDEIDYLKMIEDDFEQWDPQGGSDLFELYEGEKGTKKGDESNDQ